MATGTDAIATAIPLAAPAVAAAAGPRGVAAAATAATAATAAAAGATGADGIQSDEGGAAAVDPQTGLADTCHVYEADGVVYEAQLSFVNLAENSDKYYIVQVRPLARLRTLRPVPSPGSQTQWFRPLGSGWHHLHFRPRSATDVLVVADSYVRGVASGVGVAR